MADLKDVSLTTLKGGAAVELFDRELSRVLENIDDPNTEATEEREITLKLKIKPEDDRSVTAYLLTCKATKLAGPKTEAGIMYVGRREGGLVGVESDPVQRDMFDPEAGEGIIPIASRRQEGEKS